MSAIDRYAVFGYPVAHSQSPYIHAAFAQQTGQTLQYERRECPPDAFATRLRSWVADGRDGPVRGCNVTMPFKFEAPALVHELSPRARLAGAANVLRFDRPGWAGDNTDGAGLVRDLRHNEGLLLQGRRLLLLGAGGAAAGVLGPLLAESPARLVVANRTAARAQALVERHAGAGRDARCDLAALTLDAIAARGERFDLVINASASSLAGDAPPAPPSVLEPGCAAVDLVYGPAAQPFVDWARAHGAARASDGLGMLVEQAALAFSWWRGVTPDTAPVLAALRERLRSH
jgi:shikimate dehydrogenase